MSLKKMALCGSRETDDQESLKIVIVGDGAIGKVNTFNPDSGKVRHLIADMQHRPASCAKSCTLKGSSQIRMETRATLTLKKNVRAPGF